MECEKVCEALNLPSLFPVIFHPGPIDDIVSLHCMLFAIQYASAKSWLDSGLQVDRIIGHSFGQLTGLCVSGGLELSDAIYLISERARLIRDEWGSERGVMLSVEATSAEVQHLLSVDRDITVDVACLNGARSIILAGNEPSIEAFEKLVAQDSSSAIRTRRLNNTHAFHSRLVDNIVPALTKVAHSIQYLPSSIPLEVCSEDGDWSPVTPAGIVDHSRRQVHFQAAVERILLKVQGPAVWLQAGSASPIIPMVRRVVEASISYQEGHIYQSIDLEGPLAQKNLSQATCNLWAKGVPVQFWPFHISQAKSYNWINLPPYQFAQNRHWIDYDPFAFLPSQIKAPSAAIADDTDVFVRVLSKNSTECLCAINTKDPLYQMCTSGHAVVDQNLCPASLYIEMVVQAASLVGPGIQSSPAMPHIQNLQISAPLVLNPRGDVLLKLSRAHSDQTPWSFSLFTRDVNQAVITHATGEISLHPFNLPIPAFARFSSMNRLVDVSRLHAIESSAASSGLKGLAVYKAFRRVVNYSECYRGVDRVYATEHEAAGVVNIASSPTHDSACDPILMDNFIQVAGIHVNCLSEIRKEEVFVCTEIGEFLIGDAFLGRAGTSSHSWDIYCNLERSSKSTIACDIFVLNRATCKLAVVILAVTFKSIPIASLTRALKGLNSEPIDQKQDPKIESLYSDQNETVNGIQGSTASPAAVPQQTISRHDYFADIQEMLCDLLGMPTEELQPSSYLEDIGVDSLMRTEVLAEIKKRFNVLIATSSLAEIPDIQTLVHSIFPETPPAPLTNGCHPMFQTKKVQQIPSENDHPIILSPISIEESRSLMNIALIAFTEIKRTTAHSLATKWDGFCNSVYPKQMDLVTAYVVEAFESLGISLENLPPEQSLPQVEVLPQHDKVMRQLYAVLESSNLIQATSTGFVRTDSRVPRASSELHHEIVRLYPQHTAEHRLLKTTGSRLADCLTGAADPLALLFQNAEARQLMEDVYTNAPMFNAATRHLSQYLVGVLGRLDTSYKIRILEIGAGTGGTTKALLNQLTAVPGLRFEYTFTDLSSSLLTLARKKFKHYDFLKYQVLNIEQTPAPDMLGQYDIIISTNCIHATRNLVKSTTNIRKLLRPDGILCLIELTRNLFWFDLVFGLLEGWWLFDDGRKHALASEHVWKDSLSYSGFKWVDWSCNDSQESRILRLITASPTAAPSLANCIEGTTLLPKQETFVYGENDGVQLCADISYPGSLQSAGTRRPIGM